MGRLTLNVLLSFAQFEREVTGERIRDKIAASKARGMWMGGTLPFGYDLPAEGRRALRVNPDEAATVRLIFATYLELGSVSALERWLVEQGIGTRSSAPPAAGRLTGGRPFNRGALFYLLRNRTYLGMIVHRTKVYPGMHPAIVEPGALRGGAEPARREPAATRGAAGPGGARAADRPHLRCRRAADVALVQLWPPQQALPLLRVGAAAAGAAPSRGRHERSAGSPAPALEALLTGVLRRLAPSAPAIRSICRPGSRSTQPRCSCCCPPPSPRACTIASTRRDAGGRPRSIPPGFAWSLPMRMRLHGGRTWIVGAADAPARPDPVLIRALRAAHAMLEHDAGGEPVLEAIPASPYHRRLLRLAFLAPELQRAILAGRQPPGLTLKHLLEQRLPLLWSEQLRLFDQATPA